MTRPIPENEARRLAVLRELEILDTPPEAVYDDLTRLASKICGTPIALVSLIDADRQWFKSKVGLAADETSRDLAFCAHTIMESGPLVVEDAAADSRFAGNALVTGGLKIRFYAGVPLRMSEGEAMGSLCVIHDKPMRLTADQLEALETLGRQVVTQLSLRGALRESQRSLVGNVALGEQLQSVLDSALDGVMALDSVRDDAGAIRDFRFVVVNKAAEAMVGRAADELRGRTLLAEMPGNATTGLFERYARVVETGEAARFEHLYQHDGIDAWFRVCAIRRGDGFTVTFSDITAEKQNEQRLIEERGRLRSLIESVPDLIYYKDLEGRFLGCNTATATFFGKPRSAIVGTLDADHVPREVAEIFRENDRRVLEAGTSAANEEWVTYPDGRRVLLDTRKTPLVDETGRTFGIIGISRDITHRKAIEEKLREAQAAAEGANRAKSEFLANMSHEIRTPLTAILGFGELLRQGTEADAAQRREWVDAICGGGEHLLGLINDILDVSKIEAGRMEYAQELVDPRRLVEEVATTMRVRAENKGLSLTVRCPRPMPQAIETDPLRCRQVLMNLAGNAIKFTERGGVTLHVECDAKRRLLVVRVQDSGVGIPPEKLESVFQPFVQVDTSATRKFGGTGLGLTISRRICEALGGTLTATSEEGAGSTFTASIATGPLDGVPLAAADAAMLDAAPAPVVRSADTRLSGHVLLVEDGTTNRKLLDLLLRRLGLEVTEAVHGGECLKLTATARFDLILLDMQMPVLDGEATLRQLRERGDTTPVVAITAHAMRGDRERYLGLGCVGYVAKPVDPRQLHEVLENAMHRRTTPLPPPAAPAAAPSFACQLELDDADLREIVAQFLEELPAQIAKVRAAADAADLKLLARLAHMLRGSGGTVGFPQLSVAAAALEASALSNDLGRLKADVEATAEIAQRLHLPADAAEV